jgi:hypothetical protein
VLLTPGELPAEVVEVTAGPRGVILAEGEATGHVYVMDANAVRMNELNGLRWVVVQEAAQLLHPEHETLMIPPGVWQVKRQREYTPQGIHTVRD